MLTSVLSLTAISVNRYYIINHMKNENMNVSSRISSLNREGLISSLELRHWTSVGEQLEPWWF